MAAQHPHDAQPARLANSELARGDWLLLEQVRYRDAEGRERTWECAQRCEDVEAVCMIPRLIPSNRFLLVSQYRPPADAFVIEFPAGLVDKGESPEEAARRELLEETGYHGAIRHVGDPAPTSAGLTGETVRLVRMEIDEDDPRNAHPRQRCDDSEAITVLAGTEEELARTLDKARADGALVDSKVDAFFLARTHR